jgi:hypothetical protein
MSFPQVKLSGCLEYVGGLLLGEKDDTDTTGFARRHLASIKKQAAVPGAGVLLMDPAHAAEPI